MHDNGKINFIVVGRMAEEKGYDILIKFFNRLAKDKKLKKMLHIHLFGDGIYRTKIQEGIKNWEFVTYYGFRAKEEVFEVWKSCHYTIMLSKFLETFGLTALDGLAVGTPIIGFKKGGLSQFIQEKYKIVERNDPDIQVDVLHKKIKKVLGTFDKGKWKKESKAAKELYLGYSRDIRFSHFKNFFPSNKRRILLVSDYSADIGGIENWLMLVKKNLAKEGYKVEFFGGYDIKAGNKRIFLNLFRTSRNFFAAKRLAKKVKDFKPDLIRWNSVHRVLGRYPLFCMRKYRGTQRIMYHDFGLFHPYPSLVYKEDQVLKSRFFSGFMSEGASGKLWKYPLLIPKRISFIIIKSFLRKIIDLHLVPSAYMLRLFVARQYIGPKAAIDVLPHFIIAPKKIGKKVK